MWLTNPPDFVRQVATASGWPESPDAIADTVLAVADVLTLAGWSRGVPAGQPPPMAPPPATQWAPWPPTWPR